jgi:hypothetical protein
MIVTQARRRLVLARQVTSNARKRIAPTNLTARVELVSRTVGGKSGQRSAAGKILKIEKQDSFRRIENAQAAESG